MDFIISLTVTKKIGNHPSIRGKTHIDIKNDEIYLEWHIVMI